MSDGIIPLEINVNHNCIDNLCNTGEKLSVTGTFKNTSTETKTNKIGAKVNNIIFNEMYITLKPDEKHVFECNLLLMNDDYYDLCLFVDHNTN